MEGEGLDDIDRRILTQLRDNCRLTNEELGRIVGTNQNVIRSRIKRLESKGYILGYSVDLDYSIFGYMPPVMALLTLRPGFEEKRLMELIRLPEVKEAGFITGQYNLGIIFIVNSMDRLNEIQSIISRDPDVVDESYIQFNKVYAFINSFNPLKKNGRNSLIPPSKGIKLLDSDVWILKSLVKDARSSYSDLSRSTGLPPHIIKNHIKRMERSGIIRKCFANIDFVKLGYTGNTVLKIKIDKSFDEKSIVLQLLRIPELHSCSSVFGYHDLVASLMTRPDPGHFRQVLRKINGIKGLKVVEIVSVYHRLETNFSPWIGETK